MYCSGRDSGWFLFSCADLVMDSVVVSPGSADASPRSLLVNCDTKRPPGEFDLLCRPFVVSLERQLSERFLLVSFFGRVASVLKKLPLNESFGGLDKDDSSCTQEQTLNIKSRTIIHSAWQQLILQTYRITR
jgi:hypothetical protein